MSKLQELMSKRQNDLFSNERVDRDFDVVRRHHFWISTNVRYGLFSLQFFNKILQPMEQLWKQWNTGPME